MILLLTLAGCPKRPDVEEGPPAALPPPSAPAAPAVATGHVDGTEYVDGDLPFRLRVPEGWTAAPGTEGAPLRVAVEDPVSHCRLEVKTWDDPQPGPHPRVGCAWTYTGEGHYRVVRVADPVVVATCTPDDATGARVLGYYFEHAGRVYGLEEIVPAGALLPGKTALDDAIGGFHFALGR